MMGQLLLTQCCHTAQTVLRGESPPSGPYQSGKFLRATRARPGNRESKAKGFYTKEHLCCGSDGGGPFGEENGQRQELQVVLADSHQGYAEVRPTGMRSTLPTI